MCPHVALGDTVNDAAAAVASVGSTGAAVALRARPRIHADLRDVDGPRVGRKRLASATRRRFNLLRRRLIT